MHYTKDELDNILDTTVLEKIKHHQSIFGRLVARKDRNLNVMKAFCAGI